MQKKYSQGYVMGSAARKLEVAAPQRPQRLQEQREVKEQQRIKKNVQRAREFNFQYVVVLCAALVVVMVSCIHYLKVQSQIVTQKKEIAMLEAELTQMKEDNRINYERVMGAVS